MISASSAQETLRLAKLQDYNLLDTPPELAYDDIAKLAAYVCHTPVALVSLVDSKRQWFKSAVGLDVADTPRSIAFCSHTIQRKGLMVIEDTLKSQLFRDNPMVVGPPNIRFYAGAPLITPDGYALGSLCVVDYSPRVLSADQLQALERLSRQVVAQMELSRQATQLHSYTEHLESRVKERTAKLTVALQRLLKAQSMLVKREAALRHSSLHDPLTGLPNRSYFLQRLSQAVQLSNRRPSHLYAVLFINLDNFKLVNDAFGHEVGDLLLQYVAQQIKHLFRSSDLVARLSSDEFAVLLDGIPDKTHAIVTVERLQKRLEAPFVFEDREVFVGASIGVTFSTAGYREPETALRDAHAVMHSAKAQTKLMLQARLKAQQQASGVSPILFQDQGPLASQKFAVFDADIQGQAQARVTLADQLRQALSQNQFHLYYQPIFNLRTQTISGFEVLLRWHHPIQGQLSADAFIEVAEEMGVVRQLCAQVVQMACKQLKEWRSHRAYKTLSLHVNLSLIQLRCPQLVALWQSGLQAHQLPSSAFHLEISEGILLSSDPGITAVLQQLKSEGFGLCVDDFGRGHSSFRRLPQLEVSMLKIDSALIQKIDAPGRQDMIKTIIDLGQSANTTVIAKGIGTSEQLQFMIALGCPFGQGFWLSEALCADDINRVMTSSL
ncbi:MAG: GGDEF domain-containing protein [Phormidesmis sp.]